MSWTKRLFDIGFALLILPVILLIGETLRQTR